MHFSNKPISPEDLVEKLSLEGLNRTSNAYFEKLPDPLLQMGKPFSMHLTAAHSLDGLGMLVGGLKLAPTMSVVDFGAGTCWLSRYLLQMGCQPIAVDVSEAALKLGQKLMAEYPICGRPRAEPRFIVYDGITIDLPNDSVDRIICFDSFHHVPNQEEVLREFYRILKPSGMVGFHEPGLGHSQTMESQKEMRDFQVLENDVDKSDIHRIWRSIGPGEFRTTIHCGLEIQLNDTEFNELYDDPDKARQLLRHVLEVNRVDNIFFLSKGPWLFDSRVRDGLGSRLQPTNVVSSAPAGETVKWSVEVENTGRNRWLATAHEQFGEVALGAHLLAADGTMIDYEFARSALPHNLEPGDRTRLEIPIRAPVKGDFLVELDMVSGYVCWFAETGGEPLRLPLRIG